MSSERFITLQILILVYVNERWECKCQTTTEQITMEQLCGISNNKMHISCKDGKSKKKKRLKTALFYILCDILVSSH